ncbi:MAG: hypothetical protein K2K48_03520 [Anaeroplasmataceae bacterium]|nr:hypothetical protein [Anaeroplasmataceae bacterium]
MRKREKKHIIETSKEIPLVRGKREWNVYDVPNSILHHTLEADTHPSLVVLEYDKKVLLAELNHTSGSMKKKIKNPNTKDIKPSYLKRVTVVTKDKGKKEPITIKDLQAKRNDRILSEEEKRDILSSLNNKAINKFNLKILMNLTLEKKKKPKK